MALLSADFTPGLSWSTNDIVGTELPVSPVNPDIGTYGFRTIESVVNSLSGQLQCGLWMNAIEGDANRANIELLSIFPFKKRLTGTGPLDGYFGLQARASGTGASPTFYGCLYDDDTGTVYITKFVAGVQTNLFTAVPSGLPTADYKDWYMRFRVNGTSIKVKVWQYDQPEPAAWFGSVTDSSVVGVGHAGFYCYALSGGSKNTTGLPGFLSIGTNGETAPRPRSDREIRNYMNDDSQPKVIIAEIGVLGQTPAQEANPSKALMGNHPFVTKASDNPPNQVYDDIITQVSSFTSKASEKLSGRSSQSYGDLIVKNENGVRDNWLFWNWDGRDLDMYVGGIGWRKWDFLRVISGTVYEVYAPRRDQIGFKIRDKSALLNRKIQLAVVGGTTANAGKPQPFGMGKVFNAEPTLKNDSTFRYKFHDGVMTGATGITDVRDNGSSVAYTSDLPNGEFTLNATPVGRVTMDFTNDLTAGSATKSGNRHNRALQTIVEDRMGLGAGACYTGLRSGSLALFGFDPTDEIGLYVNDEENTLDVLDTIAISGGGFWFFNRIGQFCAAMIRVPVEPYDHILLKDDVEDDLALAKISLPSEIQQLGYKKNWTVQKDGLAGSVTPANRALYAAEAQFTAVAPSYSGLDQPSNHNLRERPRNRVLLMSTSSDAIAEASRLDSIYSKFTALITFTTKVNSMFYNLGDSIFLQYDRYGFDLGRAGIVVGLEESFDKAKVKITLFVQLDGIFPFTTAGVPYIGVEDFY